KVTPRRQVAIARRVTSIAELPRSSSRAGSFIAREAKALSLRAANAARRASVLRGLVEGRHAQDLADGLGVFDRGEHGPQGVVPSAVASEGAARREGASPGAVDDEEHVVELLPRRIDHVRDVGAVERQLLVPAPDED